ncbi:hypothetical protein PPBDW_II0045 [Photobacterium kishitanii]|nr:hypothetical protein PPBDW_II0045 [Photobacterium kishitanii]
MHDRITIRVADQNDQHSNNDLDRMPITDPLKLARNAGKAPMIRTANTPNQKTTAAAIELATIANGEAITAIPNGRLEGIPLRRLTHYGK